MVVLKNYLICWIENVLRKMAIIIIIIIITYLFKVDLIYSNFVYNKYNKK